MSESIEEINPSIYKEGSLSKKRMGFFYNFKNLEEELSQEIDELIQMQNIVIDQIKQLVKE